jgi:hypothetical protein
VSYSALLNRTAKTVRCSTCLACQCSLRCVLRCMVQRPSQPVEECLGAIDAGMADADMTDARVPACVCFWVRAGHNFCAICMSHHFASLLQASCPSGFRCLS